MAQVNAGRVRFVSRGEYNNSTQYYLFDLVDYNGSSYFAKANTTGNVPTNTTYWQLVAEKGNTGGDGPVGPTGNGIASIIKTASAGLIDTYTITFTDGTTTTFNVTNGQDGDVTQEYVDEENERLKSVFNVLPKVSDSGESIELENTGDTMLYKMDLKGNTSQEVIQGEVGLEVNDTSIYVDDVNEDKENYITLKGNTYQGGEPTPDTPQEIEVVTGLNEVKVEGKNLCNGITQNYFVNQAATRCGYAIGDSGLIIEVDGVSDYTISSNTVQTRYRVGCLNEIPVEGGSNTIVYNGSNKDGTDDSVTINTNGYKYLVVNATDLTSIQIEKSSTKTLFEEYKLQTYPISLGNIELCKIGDYKDKIAKSSGKNLFDKNTMVLSSANINTGTNKIASLSSSTTIYIPCKPSTTYTISKILTSRFVWGTTQSQPAVNVSVEYIGQDNNLTQKTITTNANAKYIVVWLYTTTYDTTPLQNVLDSIQIEEGSATPYEPYGKVWYLNKQIGKVVLDGSEDWYNAGGNAPFGLNLDGALITIGDNILPLIYCDNFQKVTQSASWSSYESMVSTNDVSSATNVLRFRYTSISGLNNFKTWLSTHNTIVYYVLATPTITEITDTTLVNQLNALYNATIYSTTHINTETSNLLPYINLKYNVVTASPSPEKASEVEVVKGNNTITISNEDGTKTQSYNITLGNIELCKIGNYQDYFYKDNGNWYKYGAIGKTTDVVGSTSITINDMINNGGMYSLYGGTLSGKTITYDSALLRQNTIYYPLSTPTQTQITDQLLVSQLDELQKAMSYYDKTIITQVNDDKPFILDVIGIRDLQDIFNIINQ